MYVLSVQYSCAVVSVFLFGGKANLVLLTLFYSTLLALTHRRKDRQRNEYTCFAWARGTSHALRGLEEPEKKSFSRLSGWCAIVITTRKKSSSRLSGGCAIVITTGKKKFQSSIWRVRGSGDYDREKKFPLQAKH